MTRGNIAEGARELRARQRNGYARRRFIAFFMCAAAQKSHTLSRLLTKSCCIATWSGMWSYQREPAIRFPRPGDAGMRSKERRRNSTEPKGELASRTLAMPADCNPKGDIFGGWIMAL